MLEEKAYQERLENRLESMPDVAFVEWMCRFSPSGGFIEFCQDYMPEQYARWILLTKFEVPA